MLWQIRRPKMSLVDVPDAGPHDEAGYSFASHVLYSFPCGTPVAIDIVVDPSVKFMAIEADSLLANGNFCEMRSHFGVEAIAVHAQVAWVRHEIEPGAAQIREAFVRSSGSSRCTTVVFGGGTPNVRPIDAPTHSYLLPCLNITHLNSACCCTGRSDHPTNLIATL